MYALFIFVIVVCAADAQWAAMAMMLPGVSWPEVHREVYRVILTHLAAIDLVRYVLGCRCTAPPASLFACMFAHCVS